MYAEPTAAVALLESVCRDDPHEPTFRLELAEARAAAGAAADALRDAAAIEADEELTVPLRARAANLAAAIHFHSGRFDDARAATARARALATDDGEIRTLEVKLRALESAFGTRTLGRVLFGDSLTRGLDPGLVVHLVQAFAARFPEDALGPYLVGRQLAHRDPTLAVDPLAEACPTEGEPRHTSRLTAPFRKECLRMLGEAAFRAGDLVRAEAAYARARAEAQTEAERLRATDFLERIAWTRGRAAR
jgi:tetratricopeptide (TPR) repeat protein